MRVLPHHRGHVPVSLGWALDLVPRAHPGAARTSTSRSLAVCEDPFATPRFERPENLTSFRALPLWGVRSSWEIDRRLASGRSVAGGAGRREAAVAEAIPAARISASSASCSGTSGTTRDSHGTARDLPLLARVRLRRGVPLRGASGARSRRSSRAASRASRGDLGYSAQLAHARGAVGRRPVDLPLALPALAADRGGRHRARDDGRRLLDGRRRLQARARRRVPPLRARHLPARVLSRRGQARTEASSARC